MFLFSINLVMEVSYWGIFSMFVCRGSWAGLRHSGTQHGKPLKRGQHKRSVPERTDYYYISCQSENEPQRTHLVLFPQHHCLCILMANKFKMLQLPQSCLSAHIELDDIYANITLISVHQSVTVQYITAGCLPCQTYYSYRLSVLQTLTIYSVSSSETVRSRTQIGNNECLQPASDQSQTDSNYSPTTLGIHIFPPTSSGCQPVCRPVQPD